MALVSVEESLERRDPRFGDDYDPYSNLNYSNYVAPNLAPRAVDTRGLKPRQLAWRAGPPPPDPFVQAFRWTLRNRGALALLGYTAWLAFWGLYLLRSY